MTPSRPPSFGWAPLASFDLFTSLTLFLPSSSPTNIEDFPPAATPLLCFVVEITFSGVGAGCFPASSFAGEGADAISLFPVGESFSGVLLWPLGVERGLVLVVDGVGAASRVEVVVVVQDKVPLDDVGFDDSDLARVLPTLVVVRELFPSVCLAPAVIVVTELSGF